MWGVPALCLSGADLHLVPQAFQRQIHERLTQLELINKQYRRLARENRTDTASKLKQMVHEGNQRWDNLQKRVTAILRRLRVTCRWPPGVLLVDVQREVISDIAVAGWQQGSRWISLKACVILTFFPHKGVCGCQCSLLKRDLHRASQAEPASVMCVSKTRLSLQSS